MTGVANRRHFDNYIMKEWKRGPREQSPVTPIVIDIDIDFSNSLMTFVVILLEMSAFKRL